MSEEEEGDGDEGDELRVWPSSLPLDARSRTGQERIRVTSSGERPTSFEMEGME